MPTFDPTQAFRVGETAGESAAAEPLSEHLDPVTFGSLLGGASASFDGGPAFKIEE